MIEDLKQKITIFSGRDIADCDIIYGNGTLVKSICFVQLVAYIEDEYFSGIEADLLSEIVDRFETITTTQLCEYIEKCLQQ